MSIKLKILESVPCKKDNSPMLHSFSYCQPFYIADSISYLHALIISRAKQNKSLKRVINRTIDQIQAISYSLKTWLVMFLIFTDSLPSPHADVLPLRLNI
jgi:hypothetical protein